MPRYLDDTVYSDTIFFSSYNGDKSRFVQEFLCKKSKFAAFYKLPKKGQYVNALRQLMTDIGRPYMIVTDSAQKKIKSQK